MLDRRAPTADLLHLAHRNPLSPESGADSLIETIRANPSKTAIFVGEDTIGLRFAHKADHHVGLFVLVNPARAGLGRRRRQFYRPQN